MTQNCPKALYNMVIGPKRLEICVLRALASYYHSAQEVYTFCPGLLNSLAEDVSRGSGRPGIWLRAARSRVGLQATWRLMTLPKGPTHPNTESLQFLLAWGIYFIFGFSDPYLEAHVT